MDKSTRLLNEYGLKLVWKDIDLEEAEKIGEPVIYDGKLVAYYVEDGYDAYSAYTGINRGNYSLAFKNSLIVSLLNPDNSVEEVFNYMDTLCTDKFDTDDFVIDRKIILKNIGKVRDGLYDVTPEVRKFFWVGKYQFIGRNDKEIDGVMYKGKGSIILSYINKSKTKRSISKLESALNQLLELGNSDNTFLTLKDISEVSGLSLSTVKRLSFLYKEEIDRYNLANFNSNNYGEFNKFCSVIKINSAIRRFIEEMELRLTQRKVASKSSLHYNTVCKLWFEKEVQEVLEEYNDWKRSLTKKQ
mgnify:FL=1